MHDLELQGIKTLMRTHIEIRNRSFMRRVHRDCFLGSDAVDFLVTHGFADSRGNAEEIGRRMLERGLIRHVSDGRKFRDASHLYYRFADDDEESSALAATNAGNGAGLFLGQGGCKFSFCPHTAHNSYILDIGLAEEIERAVAGANVDARARAFAKLRGRVKEQAEPHAPDWILSQSTTVNKTVISVFQRKRPRGDFKNAKMTGMVGESAKQFIKGIMSFERRRQWEGMFEDGVVVEGIDLGEGYSTILAASAAGGGDGVGEEAGGGVETDAAVSLAGGSSSPTPVVAGANGRVSPSPMLMMQQQQQQDGVGGVSLAAAAKTATTDPVTDFLQTVELAGIPDGMAIAFLNDPERQHALAHLRKQMLLSNPQECMLCQASFDSPADIRFCPCCAMVSCVSCVSKRVFEVVSRQVVSVCVHCCRESSRIRHPPQAVRNTAGIDASVRGKWWRPEDLGMVDYSQSFPGVKSSFVLGSSVSSASVVAAEGGSSRRDSKPLLPGLVEEDSAAAALEATDDRREDGDGEIGDEDGEGDVSILLGTGEEEDDDEVEAQGNEEEEGEDVGGQGDGVGRQVNEADSALPPVPEASAAASIAGIGAGRGGGAAAGGGGARCKTCGVVISRDMLAIEAHMETCRGGSRVGGGGGGGGAGGVGGGGGGGDTPKLAGSFGGISSSFSAAGLLGYFNSGGGGGGQRASTMVDINRLPTRIIYRTARPSTRLFRPREVCALQDSFIDPDTGACYLYEISVRHCDVRGTPGYVTADVLMLLHVARPISPTVSEITIISQVDTRAAASNGQWLLSLIADEPLAAPGTEDLVRELKASGNLQDILLKKEEEQAPEEKCNLNDFELLAVLGRGGFGKVMQVRHKTTNKVYAMKVLKKSELRRRRQVERTQTERTILAAVRHPFIVCLHYAFQNQHKLYMVMDFVQGGDFFTLMRKHKRLPEDWVRIYVGEIALALQHLHDMDVVYRDLKPENILLDGNGHLKLTDFGLSRFFETRPPAPEDMIGEDNDIVTRSFCGTEQYMSPEMLLQQGHNFRMDWWCLGLLMHEMISARHPFHGPSHYDTLRNMVTKQPTIDPRLSSQAATVVRSLLIKSPRARLCCRLGVSELKTLPFFSSLDWTALIELRVEGPYKPNLTGNMDISSFETTFTREAAVDSVGDAGDKRGDKAGKAAKGGIMGLFGLGGGGADNKKKSDDPDADSFRDFGFAKEDGSLDGGVSGFVPATPIREPVAPPPSPPPPPPTSP